MKLDRIGDMTQGDLRRFIVNLLQSDPGALPRHLAAGETLPPPPHIDGDVPVWDGTNNTWLPSSQHKVPYAGLNLANSVVSGDIVNGTLVDADISGSAAIAITKLAGGFVLNRVVVLSSGVSFTPTAGTRALYVECVGGGAGGGGAAATAATTVACGGGGGGGAYSAVFSTTNLSGAHTIAIGAAGAGVAGAGGGAGGDTSFKDNAGTTICLAKGGSGGALGAASVPPLITGGAAAGGAGGSGTGDLLVGGGAGFYGLGTTTGQGGFSGAGGASVLGAGAPAVGANNAGAGAALFGGGGSGAANAISQAARAGGSGTAGLIRIWEFF